MLEHVERITELSDSASREFSIEKALDKMEADWQGLAFELGTWKETGTHILKGMHPECSNEWAAWMTPWLSSWLALQLCSHIDKSLARMLGF